MFVGKLACVHVYMHTHVHTYICSHVGVRVACRHVCIGGGCCSRKVPPLTHGVILEAATLHTQTLTVYKAFSYVASALVVIADHQAYIASFPLPRLTGEVSILTEGRVPNIE